MATNEDRRRVAAELRASIPGDCALGRGNKAWSLLYRTIFGHYMRCQSSGKTYSEVASRLADLIEPASPMSRHDAGDVDRDALLALADEMRRLEGSAEHPYVAKTYLHRYSSRIREACGVAVDED